MTLYRKWGFPILAGLLWLAFLTLDLTGWGDSTWVKFAAVCLCCLTAIMGAKTTDGKLVALALCFTVGADWFLLVRNDNYELGIGLFIVVQLIYAYRLWHWKHCEWSLLTRLVVFLVFLVCLFWLFNALSITCGAGEFSFYMDVALFYFSNLCVNTFEAFAQSKRTFAWGLFLFVFCDLCVGAYNLDIFPAFTWWGSWLFYLPSQVLIVLSQELETGDLDEKRF